MNELLRPHTVAKLLNVSVQKLYAIVDEGRLEAVRLGPRSVRFRRRDIEKIVNGETSPSPRIDSQS